eukprot:CAMPEP_0119080400 /NCGR_PEP_ID=MMETSP1178-20130426/111790_1 /TAXON_ID=33656 /ORGANISM="unid sp, Strain CCMP2000" /LENGTH=230 /DNA_ID=CAMNT_0007062995 /DNA_START=172 /DNA_END=864 /DNA_ORIENTATION=+
MTAVATSTPAPHPLPDLSHLGSADFERVYEPSDDTFLLVDALAADTAWLQALSVGLCVEIGCGSGAVITHLASLLPPRSAWMVGSDVSGDALRASAATAARNGASLQPLQMDLLSALRPNLIDVLVFNPPYVPTSVEELRHAVEAVDISAAWAGGPRGRLVLDRLLPQLGRLLSPRGVFYLLGVRENEPDEIAELLAAQGFSARTVAERRAQNERLFVMRFAREGQGGGR